MTNYLEENPGLGVKGPADELDVIEAYGGEGPHNPNSKGEYCATTHFWNQGPDAKKRKHASLAVPLRTIGGGSSWWETFHTYGCKITETDTIYYCDDIEVARDPTGPVSRSQPFFFMINLAIGGNGWPVDLSRCQGVADMYVDYIRVYGAANGSPAP
jgi:beta-glucanase (GH16 family)